MLEFIGRFHPILVHFPIGLFVTYLGIELFMNQSKKETLSHFNLLLLQLGCISSILSIITGYVLSLEESNPANAVDIHKWTAITTTALFLGYYLAREKIFANKKLSYTVHLVLFAGIGITGHQGGTLTHGENFLFQSPNKNTSLNQQVEFKVDNIVEAKIYQDVVQFTLNQKCVSCHGAERQKGKLRMDDQNWISRGGKGGMVLNVSAPEESELIKRIMLDDIDEHHMPPKEKPQLTSDEKTILTWWIKSGISFDATVDQLKPDSAMLIVLKRFTEQNKKTSGIALSKRIEIAPLDQSVLRSIQNAGWVVQPISKSDNHVRVIGYNLILPVSEALDLLKPHAEHVVELKLSFKNLVDADGQKITILKNLEKLWVDHTPISDAFFSGFEALSHVRYINLSFTKASAGSIAELSKCKSLETIYGYKTKLTNEKLPEWVRGNSKLKIVLGDSMQYAITDSIFKKAED